MDRVKHHIHEDSTNDDYFPGDGDYLMDSDYSGNAYHPMDGDS